MSNKSEIKRQLKEAGLKVVIDPNLSGSVDLGVEGRIGIRVSTIDIREMNYSRSPPGAVYEISATRETYKGIRILLGTIYVNDEGNFSHQKGLSKIKD
ncbi:MAG: hypothetical protein KKF68_02750 [Nanoarchaeota archaeon]|nr:hypothetical protein [Nanoarchaeota archaeon]